MEFGKGRHQSSLVKNFNFNPDKKAAKGSDLIQETMNNWSSCLEEAGITWDLVKQWFIQKKEKKEAEEKQKKEKEKEKET
ncbi:hypothetical protein FOCG_05816 [Fusarium oxysporum f. sp. radicis-lycopersici 26381]|nr:hypothetical protein FOCG_05816 [Fusarium oxysporum f. sp. radicis-lycopersici 26381]